MQRKDKRRYTNMIDHISIKNKAYSSLYIDSVANSGLQIGSFIQDINSLGGGWLKISLFG